MKKAKRIFAIFMTLTLAMSMLIASSAMSFAANGATNVHKITITNDDQVGDHTYQAYQVFAGDYDATSKKLSNISWGAGVNGTAILNAVKADTATFGEDAAKAATAADVANLLGTGTDTAIAKKFAAIVGANLGTTVAGESTKATAGYEISVTGDGYYFVKDKEGTLPTDGDQAADHKGDAETRYILRVVDDVTVDAKSSTVKSEKKVNDINDSTGTAENLKDSADHDIGDSITYTLTATLPDNYADYATYSLAFVDDMSKGLTLNADSVKIFFGSGDTTGSSITFTQDSQATSAYTDGKVYKYSIANLKADDYSGYNLGAGSVVKITYTATLNNDAVLGKAGNPNKYHIEYSNNPNGDGTGTTPDDKNIVFTYQVTVNKIDPAKTGDDKSLVGADFTLYKKVTGATVEGARKGSDIKAALIADNASIKADALDANSYYIVVGNKTGSAAGSTFSFKGVDDGSYVLVETTIPAGYNAWDSTAFDITADHDLASDNPQLNTLKGGDLFTGNVNTGVLSADIENQSGAVLPATGGIGTIIFYVLGTLLVVGCGIVLISKKRMENK